MNERRLKALDDNHADHGHCLVQQLVGDYRVMRLQMKEIADIAKRHMEVPSVPDAAVIRRLWDVAKACLEQAEGEP